MTTETWQGLGIFAAAVVTTLVGGTLGVRRALDGGAGKLRDAAAQLTTAVEFLREGQRQQTDTLRTIAVTLEGIGTRQQVDVERVRAEHREQGRQLDEIRDGLPPGGGSRRA